MSRGNNQPHPNSNDNDDERNPFVAFRRFTDEQFSTAARGLGDISSFVGDVITTVEQAERDARTTWKKFEDHYERAMNPERKRLEGKDDVQAHQTACSRRGRPGQAPPPQQDNDDSSATPTDSWFHSPFWTRSGFGRRRWRDAKEAEQAAVRELTNDMFFFHPYSPFQLEEADELKGSSLNWRRAFEDLMRAQQGQALTDSTQYARQQHRSSEDEPWARHPLIRGAEFHQWKNSLQQRQLMKDGFFTVGEPWSRGELWQSSWATPYAIQHAARFERRYGSQQQGSSGSGSGSGAETELDMYEQFLGRQVRSSSSTPPEASSAALLPSSEHSSSIETPTPTPTTFAEQKQQHSSAATAEGDKPSIIATLTTTERRMQSDGTVTTKTVLKKRFSDGTEHSEESSNTAQVPIHELKWPDASAGASARLLVPRRTLPSPQQQQAGTEEAPKKSSSSSSWFWSS